MGYQKKPCVRQSERNILGLECQHKKPKDEEWYQESSTQSITFQDQGAEKHPE